jgi:hypothetical protein
VVRVAEGTTDHSLEDPSRLRETLSQKLDEFFGQGSRRLLALDLEDRLQVLGDLRHPGARNMREHVALDLNDAPLPPYAQQLARHRRHGALVVV